MAEAEVPEVPIIDIPPRQTNGKVKPHIDQASYQKNYKASIDDGDAFWGKVSLALSFFFVHWHAS